MEVFTEISFEAAHRLPNVPPDHRCAALHGHSYKVRLQVRGGATNDAGWVVDFADIEKAFRPLLEQLDHRYLNQVEGLENPTSENLSRWIWRKLKPALPALSGVVVQETPATGCVYRGEDD